LVPLVKNIIVNMKIPFANRTVDVDLPAVDGQNKITVKGIIDDFSRQLPSNFSALLEAFVLLSPRRVRVTCRTQTAMEEFCHLGLTFQSQAISVRPCKTAKWVSLSWLSYGIPEETIREVLAPFGRVIQVKMDSYRGVYVGTRNMLMDISKPIPSRVLIAGHWCHIYYNGQTPTCFACHKPGHSFKDCPDRRGTSELTQDRPALPRAARSPASRAASGDRNNCDEIGTVKTNPGQPVGSSPAQSYAKVTGGNTLPVGPNLNGGDLGSDLTDVGDDTQTIDPPATVDASSRSTQLHVVDTHQTAPHKNSEAADETSHGQSDPVGNEDTASGDDDEDKDKDDDAVDDDEVDNDADDDDDDDDDEDDDDDDDDDDKYDSAEENMDTTSGSNKRGRNEDDSSDDNERQPDKKGKSIPLSPNRFAALVDEASKLPLPPEDENTAIDLPPCDLTPKILSERNPMSSFSDNESLLSDLNSDNPVNPDHVDDSPRPATDNETLDSPLTPLTPNLPRVDSHSQSSQSSSSGTVDPFTLAITSKRTRPTPVVGSRKRL